MHINKDIKSMIERELEPYPINYTIDDRSTTTCFLEMISGDGCKARVGFSPRANGHTILHIRSDIRRKIKEMDVRPVPEMRRQARISGLGERLMEAAASTIDIDTTPKEKSMTNKPTNIVPIVNGHANVEDKGPAKDRCQFVKMQQGEIARATRFLIANAEIDDTTKTVKYAQGWDDERIAKILAAEPDREGLTAKHIAAMRRDSFGLTPTEHLAKRPKTPASIEGMAAQIRELQDRVLRLEEAATRP